MKKLSLYAFLVLMFCNVGFADHRTFDCSEDVIVLGTPSWEDPVLHDDPNAPWNHFLHADSLLAPWNNVFCSKEDINKYIRDNGFSKKYFWK